MDKSFCFFFQKEALSCAVWARLNAGWYKARLPMEALHK
jgi:hypothetical protein